MNQADILRVPVSRAHGLQQVLVRVEGLKSLVLTTHINADADGTGSAIGFAEWLGTRGISATLVNPTPFPQNLRFLLEGSEMAVADWGTAGADRTIAAADLVVVLDTGEPGRIGGLLERLSPERTLIIDHHPASASPLAGFAVRDPSAAATGEMIWDLIALAGDEPTPLAALALYVALVGDTGSFRYSNTTPRVHAIAADLLSRGVDPEAVYRRLFATAPRRRLELLREALGTLSTDPKLPLSWMTVTEPMIRRTGASGEDFEGLNEFARSLEGTEVAILFQETEQGGTRISFRSNGAADVRRIAAEFGGGGHVKAAGARLDAPPAEVVPQVLDAARAALAELRYSASPSK